MLWSLCNYKNKPHSLTGFSLIEVLISVSILGFLALGTASMINNQTREMRALSEKIAVLEFEHFIDNYLADGLICSYLANHLPTGALPWQFVDSPPILDVPIANTKNSIASFPLSINGGPQTALAVGSQVALSQTVIVDSIAFSNITYSSSGKYKADLNISFQVNSPIRAFKPIQIPMLITTIPGGAPGGIQTIVGCNGNKNGVSCPSNQVMIGINLDGSPNCQTAPVVGGGCQPGTVVTGVNSNGSPICTSCVNRITLYEGIVPFCNDRVVTTNPGHMGCATRLLGDYCAAY